MGVYDEARERIAGDLESYFPGGEFRGADYFIPAIDRDERTPSLAIRGQSWYDHGSGIGGSILDLYAKKTGMEPIEAAKMISNTVDSVKKQPKNKRASKPARQPAPDGWEGALKKELYSEYSKSSRGTPESVYKYFKNESLFMAVVRFQTASGKTERPFYWTGAGFRAGMPPGETPPIFREEKIQDNKKILVVEGEKCGVVEVDGYSTVSWHGGTSRVLKSDWSQIRNRDVVMWPDADDVGIKAMKSLCSVLKEQGNRIKIVGVEGWEKGYDIADHPEQDRARILANAEPINTEPLPIPDPEIQEEKTTPEDSPWSALGFSETHLFILSKRHQMPLKIARGETALKNDLNNLAPPEWWAAMFPGDHSEIDVKAASDYVRLSCLKKGFFRQDQLKGVGVYVDGDSIILNTGDGLIVDGAEQIRYDQYSGPLVFSRGHVPIKKPTQPWHAGHCEAFLDDLSSFGFKSGLELWALVGWIAIAPWSNVFLRSPHLWITGSAGSGKTMLLDEVLGGAFGDSAIRAEGRTSEAGIRQAIGDDCRPVIIDEFEPENDKAIGAIEAMLTLARSAYGGQSIYKGSASHEAVVFSARFSMCFASVQTHLRSSALQTRIIPIELGKKTEKNWSGATDMAGLRALSFDKLQDLIKIENAIKDDIKVAGIGGRIADTFAPVLAGACLVKFGGDMNPVQCLEFCSEFYEFLEPHLHKAGDVSDEDAALRAILHMPVKISSSMTVAAAEIIRDQHLTINEANQSETGLNEPQYNRVLTRLGVRAIRGDQNEPNCIYISKSNPELKNYMKSQGYIDYVNILRRHANCINTPDDKPKYMAGNNERVIMIEILQNN